MREEQSKLLNYHTPSKITDINRIAELEKENAELKEQIEKMKCCAICNHNKGGCSYHHNWTKDCLENNHKYFELKELAE